MNSATGSLTGYPLAGAVMYAAAAVAWVIGVVAERKVAPNGRTPASLRLPIADRKGLLLRLITRHSGCRFERKC